MVSEKGSHLQSDLLRQALALAIVQKRRKSAEISKWRKKSDELEQEVKRLKSTPALEDPIKLVAKLIKHDDKESLKQLPCCQTLLWKHTEERLSLEQRYLLGQVQR